MIESNGDVSESTFGSWVSDVEWVRDKSRNWDKHSPETSRSLKAARRRQGEEGEGGEEGYKERTGDAAWI